MNTLINVLTLSKFSGNRSYGAVALVAGFLLYYLTTSPGDTGVAGLVHEYIAEITAGGGLAWAAAMRAAVAKVEKKLAATPTT